MKPERKDFEKINKLALEVLNLAKNTITINLRFMDSAISALRLRTYNGTIATDSLNLYYDPTFILKSYKKDKNQIAATYMHILLHCVFRHYKTEGIDNPKLWDLACDIAVENVISELNLAFLEVDEKISQEKILFELKDKIGKLSAKKIYTYYIEKGISDKKIASLHSHFKIDEHFLWYLKEHEIITIKNTQGRNLETEWSRTMKTDSLEGAGISSEGVDFEYDEASEEEQDEIWESISKKMQVDLETFSKSKGNTSGGMIQNLKEINRQKYDYSTFLKKFAVLDEKVKLNQDEFDYIFYSYGLELYGNIPLIEPLEYKEDYSIKEFVIAIDTSASVSGELVQKFLEKTYNILKQEESFSKRINLRIIQCDASIREDIKISNKKEFDEYMKRIKIKGFGSTDFRPVFEHIEKLREEKEIKNLKGLIYFTDGYGTFPEHQPDYKSAFIFIDDEYNNPDVPIWAIKLILQSDEI